jgi:hypothetical protein
MRKHFCDYCKGDQKRHLLVVEDLSVHLSVVTFTDSKIVFRKLIKPLKHLKVRDLPTEEATVDILIGNVRQMMRNCGQHSDCDTCKHYIAMGMWQTYWANR